MNQKILNEIISMTREELIAAKNELTADSDLPKKEKGQIMAAIDARLSSFKKKKEPENIKQSGFFYSFMDGEEFVSCISPLPIGDFIVKAEPYILISAFPLSAEQYAEMKEKDWEEFV
jgi:hypothetical protein